MKKHALLLLPVITALLLFCFAVSANADTEGIFTYYVANDQATVTAITPENGDDIVIPDTLGGYPVTTISDKMYLRSIPYIIGSVYIPAGITDIRGDAFCAANLQRLYVAEENPAFSSDNGVLLNKEQTILFCCPPYYPEAEYRVPDTVTEIGDSAFSNAKHLTKVILPQGVTKLGNLAFGFTSTLGDVNIPDTVTTIDQNCFGYNTAIEKVLLPESVVNIYNSAFTDCTSLKTVMITGNVTRLMFYAFDNTAIETLYLPASLTNVDANTFVRTNTIQRILFAGSREQWEAITVGENNGNFTEAEVFFDYPITAFKNITANETDGMLTLGGSGALPGMAADTYRMWDGYADAETLYLTGDITAVGENSFTGFSGLSSVIVDCAARIDPGAFNNCENLRSVILLNGGSFAADSFPGNGAGINLFAADGAPSVPENSAVSYVPVSYRDGVLSYGGNAAQNSYDFFDVLSVFCSRYGEIRQLQVESFSFDDIRVYYYDTATGARRVIDGPLTNGVIYPQLDVDGTPTAITYNALCSGIADGTITSFYLVINDETHPETQDTQISIVEQISNLFRKALRAIVTLLNKLFRLLKNFG